MKNVLVAVLLFANSFTAFSSETILLGNGSYSTIELSNKTLLIDGNNVIVSNINMNGASKIIVPAGKKLTLLGSLNLNGSDSVFNYGIFTIQNLELQNGSNYLLNEGIFTGEEAQINDKTSSLKDCGTMTFSQNLNLNSTKAGAIYICDCAILTTNGLNVNAVNPFDGGGGLVVNGNLNLNNPLGKGIYFVYGGHINNTQHLSEVERVDQYFTCERALPIVYSSVVVNKKEVSFEVTAPDQIEKFIIQTSRDGKTWKNEKVIPITGKGAVLETKYTYIK